MLAATPFPTFHFALPARSSPLSPRNTDTAPRSSPFSMMSNQNEKISTPQQQRVFRPNPAVRTREATTQKRRDMFFRRVQKGRDDKKWDARGEQIQRQDYICEHKRWEAEKARQAKEVQDEVVDEEENQYATSSSSSFAPSSSAPQPEQEAEQAEYVNAQEEWELQQLIASMDEEPENTSQHYGSDDEDYDYIFMECASTTDLQEHVQVADHMDAVDEMDMS